MTPDLAKLSAPFPPDRVSWRVGSTTADKKRGMALAYIDARDVMERLDAVCGPERWQCSYPHATGKTVCSIGIKVDDEWVWKADGAGDTDVEAEKGALSDAFKRAAVRWGIGRYLYDIPSPWVELEARGKSYSIPDAELSRLARLLANDKTATAPRAVPNPPPAPAPAVQKPAPAPDKQGADRLAIMSIEIAGLMTLAEMDDWRKKPDNVDWYASLAPSKRAEFQRTLNERRAEITKRAGAAA